MIASVRSRNINSIVWAIKHHDQNHDVNISRGGAPANHRHLWLILGDITKRWTLRATCGWVWFSILLPVFVPVCGSGVRMGGQGRWCGRWEVCVWCGVGSGWGLSTVRRWGSRGGRWKSEQSNLAQWELRCRGAQGSRGGACVWAGITVVKETVICPRPGPFPQSSMVLLSLPLSLGHFFWLFPLNNGREGDRLGGVIGIILKG